MDPRIQAVPSPARLTVLALCLMAFNLTISAARAQSTPDNNLQNQRDEEQRQRLRQRMEVAPPVHLQRPPQLTTEKIPQEEACRPIQAVRAEPALLRHDQLDEALSGPLHDDPPQGRCIGVAGLKLLAQRAQEALISSGFITSEVEIRPQDLRSGTLVLSIIPSRIGDVRSTQELTSPRWKRFTLAVRPGDVLNLRDIEQSLENLRHNGDEVNIQIVHRKEDGLSDILIDHRPGERVRINLAANDTGSPTTGKYLGDATLSFNNLLGWSELAYLNLARNLIDRSGEPRGNHSYTIHADVPTGYWLFGVTWGWNANHQTVVGPSQSYRYAGRSQTMDIQLSRVLQRDALGKTTLTIGAFARRSQNYIDDTEIQVQHRRTGGWELALSRSQRLDNLMAEARLRYRRGTGAFGSMPAPEEGFGEGTSRMQVLQASLQLQAPLRFSGLPMALNSEVRLQWHRTPLTPQDRMCLGGRYTVRGFDENQTVCGQSGQLLRNELNAQVHDLPVIGYAGVDLGRVTGQPDALQQSETLIGAFAGLRGALPVGSGQWDLFVGAPWKKPSSQASSHPVAGFQISANF